MPTLNAGVRVAPVADEGRPGDRGATRSPAGRTRPATANGIGVFRFDSGEARIASRRSSPARPSRISPAVDRGDRIHGRALVRLATRWQLPGRRCGRRPWGGRTMKALAWAEQTAEPRPCSRPGVLFVAELARWRLVRIGSRAGRQPARRRERVAPRPRTLASRWAGPGRRGPAVPIDRRQLFATTYQVDVPSETNVAYLFVLARLYVALPSITSLPE